MPRFYFHLRAAGAIHRDAEGSECADLAAARLHAERVASDLMRNASPRRRLWSLRVEDERGGHVFDVFFADVDEDVIERRTETQALAQETSRRLAALIDTGSSARQTMSESAMLLARARGKPQLAYGQKTQARRK